MRHKILRAVAATLLVWAWSLNIPVAEGSDLLPLARGGKSEYQVVIAADAEEPVPTAAKEFVHFFKEITGAELAIVTDEESMGEREIMIGPSKHVENLATYIDWEKLGKDGYVIRTVRDHVLLFGGSGQGTANAVYTFLEEQLGCRWYTPSFSVIPKRADLSVDLIHEERVPPFEARGLSCTNSADPAWAARNRINCFNPSLRWAFPGEEGHDPAHIEELYANARLAGAMKFAWPGSFGRGYWLHTLGKGNHFLPKNLFEEHPEYFGMNAEGERDVEITPCLAHPDVLAIVLENAKKWLVRTPGARVISISQSDKPPRDYCRCERCQEAWKKYTYTVNKNPLGRLPDARLPGWTEPELIRPVWDPNSTAGTTVGPTGVLLEFVNRVAEALEEEYPEVLVHTLAYYWTKYPPDNVSLHRNVVVDFAPLNSCYYHPLSACPFNEEFKGLWTALRRWRKLTPHVWVWRYDQAGGPDRMLPRPTLRYLDLYMRELAQAEVTGVYFFTYEFKPWMWMNDLRSWLFAKLMWDPEYDMRQGMEEFIRAYYGEAGEAILAYVLDTQERESYGDTTDGQIKKMFPGTFHVGGGGIPIAASAISRWDKLFDDAEAAVMDNPEHLERVKVARLSVQRAALEFLPAAHPVRKKAYVEFFPVMEKLGMSEAGLKQMREKYDPAKKKVNRSGPRDGGTGPSDPRRQVQTPRSLPASAGEDPQRSVRPDHVSDQGSGLAPGGRLRLRRAVQVQDVGQAIGQTWRWHLPLPFRCQRPAHQSRDCGTSPLGSFSKTPFPHTTAVLPLHPSCLMHNRALNGHHNRRSCRCAAECNRGERQGRRGLRLRER